MADDHRCLRSEEFGEINTTVKLLKDKVMGNGHEGLDTTVPRLETSLLQLTEEVLPDLKSAIRGFTLFMTEAKTEDRVKADEKEKRMRYEERRKLRNRWIIGILIMACSTLGGWVIAIQLAG